MAQFLGRAKITTNGTTIETNKGATLDVGGIKNNPVVTGSKVGRAEELVPATIECETSLAAGMSLEDLRNLKEATVIFECDTGQSYVVRNAFRTDTLTMKDGEGGNVSLKIAGDPAEELM